MNPPAGWYGSPGWLWLLLPLEVLFRALVWLRRLLYRRGWKPSARLPVPVIVVGNLSVGGTGKTPLTIWLAERLLSAGHRPGIVSRGYGGHSPTYPLEVTGQSDPAQAGDEPVLLASRTGLPVVVGPDRVAAARHLLQAHDCDVILADDGLQHYALGRELEIVVIDAARGLGNGHCLPVGPLREPPSRLREVDLVVWQGCKDPVSFILEISRAHPLKAELASRDLSDFTGRNVHAVAGIGNPKRFFDALTTCGLRVREHTFEDHHAYRPEELRFADQDPVLMTEKDGVKCKRFAQDHWFTVPAQARPAAALVSNIERLLEAVMSKRAQSQESSDG